MELQAVFALVAQPWERSFVVKKPSSPAPGASLSLSEESKTALPADLPDLRHKGLRKFCCSGFPEKSPGLFLPRSIDLTKSCKRNSFWAKGLMYKQVSGARLLGQESLSAPQKA